MNRRLLSGRKLLKAVAALPLAYAAPLRAEPPPAQAITPALIAAATKEGQLTWYTSADLQLAEKVGKAFEQKFRGVSVRVERRGDASFHGWRRNMRRTACGRCGEYG
jgi:iron(III) transport system substrate-binding protein